MLTTVVSILLSLVSLGSAIAFTDLVSLTVAALYPSYFVCCALLLWRRCSGHIKPHSDLSTQIGPDNLAWGRWRIPGVLGILNNIFACVFLVVLWFFSFWPPETPVTPATMNFSCVMFGAVLIASLFWYYVSARKTYVSPLCEL